MNKYLKRVTGLAVLSRICIILLQLISNILITDHESDGFITPAIDLPRSIYDNYVFRIFGGFLRWDAHYFMNVATYGYVFENTLAFFPGYPLCIRAVGALLQLVCHQYLNTISIYLISSIVINLIFFVLATRSLFYLTCKTLNDPKLAYLAAALFTVNPASIFFSAPYSEALFSYLSFQAMLHDNIRTSSIYVALSSLVRSNGLVNLGFPLYRRLKTFFNHPFSCRSIVSFLFNLIFIFFISISLFAFYQMYCHSSFCSLYPNNFNQDILKLAEKKSFILPGQNITKMCDTLPYFYVQEQYWNVGFLHYFQFKQLPNFALAFPIIYLSLTHCAKYFYQNLHLILTLGMKNPENIRVNFFPYGVHLISLVVICLFFVHIQVSTRLLCSSSPAIYWFGAVLLKKKTIHRVNIFGYSLCLHPVLLYFLLYSLIGTVLFSNFYPWT